MNEASDTITLRKNEHQLEIVQSWSSHHSFLTDHIFYVHPHHCTLALFLIYRCHNVISIIIDSECFPYQNDNAIGHDTCVMRKIEAKKTRSSRWTRNDFMHIHGTVAPLRSNTEEGRWSFPLFNIFLLGSIFFAYIRLDVTVRKHHDQTFNLITHHYKYIR
jgi:hypothetical protein